MNWEELGLPRDTGVRVGLTAVKGFAAWLVKDRRFPDNPPAHLEPGNHEADS